MTPSLEAALAECDELNILLWMTDGKLSFRAGEFGFPDRLRDALRSHRDELSALLSDHPVAVPEWTPFLARNVDVRWFPSALVGTVSVILVSGKPYYRLTPSIWARFCRAVDQRAASIGSDPIARGEVEAAADVLTSLGRWVAAHYRLDQIRRAWNNPHPLPYPPRMPHALGGKPDNQERGQPAKVATCPTSPKSSRCGLSKPSRREGRRRTSGATIATGNDSASLF